MLSQDGQSDDAEISQSSDPNDKNSFSYVTLTVTV